MLKRVVQIFKMIRFTHTVFAFPFAMSSMFIAKGGWPSVRELLLIAAAMVTARSSAMAFNRIVDVEIDRLNPRTMNWHLPRGIISIRSAIIFTAVCSLLFIVSSFFINRLAFALSPVAVFIIFFYSFTKRFTNYSHFILGFCLAIAPVGAWIAIKGRIDLVPILLGAAVLFWVAGFDIIYSIQDYEFDKKNKLYSMVVRFGIGNALDIARLCHFLSLISLAVFGIIARMGMIYFCGLSIIAFLLFYEHLIMRGGKLNLSKINIAFFNINAIVSFAVLLFSASDVLFLS